MTSTLHYFYLRQTPEVPRFTGDKSGVTEKRFYRELIRKADELFDAHLFRLKNALVRKKGSSYAH